MRMSYRVSYFCREKFPKLYFRNWFFVWFDFRKRNVPLKAKTHEKLTCIQHRFLAEENGQKTWRSSSHLCAYQIWKTTLRSERPPNRFGGPLVPLFRQGSPRLQRGCKHQYVSWWYPGQAPGLPQTTSEHRSMYQLRTLSIDRCTATYV